MERTVQRMTQRALRSLRDLHEKYPRLSLGGLGFMAVLAIYSFSKVSETTTTVYQSADKSDVFKDGRIIGSQVDSIYDGKERLFLKSVRDIQENQKLLKGATEKLEARLIEMEKQHV